METLIQQLPTRETFARRLVHTGRITTDEQLQLLTASDDEIEFYDSLWSLMDLDIRKRFDRFLNVTLRRADAPADSPHARLYMAMATCCYLI